MPLLRRILDLSAPQPSDLLPNSKNLAMKHLLRLSETQSKPDPRPNELPTPNPLSDLRLQVPPASR